MTYGAFLIANPLFWSAVAGVSFGGAVATASRNVKNVRHPDRARSRKWTAAALWATVGVLAATGGILIPDGTGLLTLPSLFVGLGALAFCALGLRFPRAGGIAAILVLATIAVVGPILMRSFVPVRNDGVAAVIQLLSVDESGVYIEVADHTPGASDPAQVVVTDRPTIVARGHWLWISEYLFFLGARGGIVLDALSADPSDAESQALKTAEARTDQAPVFPETPIVEWIISRLPLLELSSVQSAPERLGLLREYEIVCYSDGTLRVELVSLPE